MVRPPGVSSTRERSGWPFCLSLAVVDGHCLRGGRLLLIAPSDDNRKRLAAVESKLAAQAKRDAAPKEKPPAKKL
jgi:hypothetical protein